MKRRCTTLVLALLAGSCTPAFVSPPHDPLPPPARSEVEAVLFLVGDAGDALQEASPLVHKLRGEVEEWAGALQRDSAVTVAFLGDNIYPVGLHDRGHPEFARDSAHLAAQVWALDGPEARAGGAFGIFVPGNHDWGNAAGPEGAARLLNQERMLRAFADEGTPVVMLPAGGSFGPEVVEPAGAFRLVLLDTQWWLQEPSEALRRVPLADLAAALNGESGQPVIVAAHHPYATGGPHAGRTPGFDPLWLLRRTGAIVQDLNDGPFEDLVETMETTFREVGRPLVWVGGHDHSLQVIEGQDAGDPQWSLVSGAGSKLTPVAEVEGLQWASRQPGYMRLMFLEDGSVDVYVVGAPEENLRCDGPNPAECVAQGISAFRVVYSARLR